MGEAKRRGTFEQRKAAAIAKQQKRPEITYPVLPLGMSVQAKECFKLVRTLRNAHACNHGIIMIK